VQISLKKYSFTFDRVVIAERINLLWKIDCKFMRNFKIKKIRNEKWEKINEVNFALQKILI
jgi:hypothetical protein